MIVGAIEGPAVELLVVAVEVVLPVDAELGNGACGAAQNVE